MVIDHPGLHLADLLSEPSLQALGDAAKWRSVLLANVAHSSPAMLPLLMVSHSLHERLRKNLRCRREDVLIPSPMVLEFTNSQRHYVEFGFGVGSKTWWYSLFLHIWRVHSSILHISVSSVSFSLTLPVIIVF